MFVVCCNWDSYSAGSHGCDLHFFFGVYEQSCCFSRDALSAQLQLGNKLAVAVLGAATNHGHSNELFSLPVKAMYPQSLVMGVAPPEEVKLIPAVRHASKISVTMLSVHSDPSLCMMEDNHTHNNHMSTYVSLPIRTGNSIILNN